MTTADDHLPSPAVEDFDGFTFGATDWFLGFDLSLEWTDFSGLLRCELELKLQPVVVTTTANDEGAGEGVETVFANLVDGSSTIKVN